MTTLNFNNRYALVSFSKSSLEDYNYTVEHSDDDINFLEEEGQDPIYEEGPKGATILEKVADGIVDYYTREYFQKDNTTFENDEQKKQRGLELKQELGAKYMFVNYTYDTPDMVFTPLYSDVQSEFVKKLWNEGSSIFGSIIKQVCTKENADQTEEELEKAYWNLVDIDD